MCSMWPMTVLEARPQGQAFADLWCMYHYPYDRPGRLQVSYSITLPTEDEAWKELGVFSAKEKQGEQRFTVEKPEYARYLRFDILSHHGKEFFCTLSQIK